MAKDMGGFMKSFAGNLGKQLGGGGLSGLGQIGGPMSGIGIIKGLMGGGDEDEGPQESENPGQAMFNGEGGSAGPMKEYGQKKQGGFGKQFLHSLSDNLFQNAMMGFMGRR